MMETRFFMSDHLVNSRLWTPEEKIRSLWGQCFMSVSLSLSLTHTHTHRLSLSLSGNEPNPPLKLKVDEVAVLVIGRPSDEVTACVCVEGGGL